MDFKFQYIGPPFENGGGSVITVMEHDVPDLRRASHDWKEVSDTTATIVEPKYIKIKGKPKAVLSHGDI
jgi:hypothetical protein